MTGELIDFIAREGAARPWMIFGALALLPAIGLPASALLVMAGAAWGNSWTSWGWSTAAIGVNIGLCHLLAAGPGKKLIGRLCGARLHGLSPQSGVTDIKLALLLRVTPGIPFCLQNYAIGLCGISMARNLAVSLPISSLYAAGFVICGSEFLRGERSVLIAGIGSIVLLSLAARLAWRALESKSA